MSTDPSQKRGSAGMVSVSQALRTSLAENTRRAYRSGWRKFAAYCDRERLDPMAATPDDVAGFLVAVSAGPASSVGEIDEEKPLALGTIRICLAAINRKYGERNLESPARHLKVATVLRGLGRLANERPRRVKALREHEIGAILSCCDRLAAREESRAIAVRDAAVLAVGFAGALRRSEICGLRLEDVEFLARPDEAGGMFLHVRRSKTDQFGKGQSIAIPEGVFHPAGRATTALAGPVRRRGRAAVPDALARWASAREAPSSD